ncbi:MAG: hypothetical protein QOI61_897, partial [Actinomycetota bacterium]
MAKSAAERAELVQLEDGTEVTVRQIGPADAPALIRSHTALSDDARRRRFFSPHPVLSEKEAQFFAAVDHTDREAFVVLHDDVVVGVGRYDRLEPTVAEVAFVVGDEWQSHGIATLLLRRLADRAVEVGITRFVAETMGDNQAMITVFKHWAPDRKVTYDSG